MPPPDAVGLAQTGAAGFSFAALSSFQFSPVRRSISP
jgi:hypothetical protein